MHHFRKKHLKVSSADTVEVASGTCKTGTVKNSVIKPAVRQITGEESRQETAFDGVISLEVRYLRLPRSIVNDGSTVVDFRHTTNAWKCLARVH